jgi:hypothetical protein
MPEQIDDSSVVDDWARAPAAAQAIRMRPLDFMLGETPTDGLDRNL